MGIVSLTRSKAGKAVVLGLFVCMIVLGLSLVPTTAQAAEWCVNGSSYHDSGTAHNYVQFKVNFSAQNWIVRHDWLSWTLPATLWAFPDSNGIAKAGINRTDYNPPFDPSHYKLCGWR